MHTVARKLPVLVRELDELGYDGRIAWWIALYADRYDTLSGCPWIEPHHLPRLRALIGERGPADFRPELVAFRTWCSQVGITSYEAN